MYDFSTADEALITLLRDCKSQGVYRKPEWQESGCTEFPHPVMFRLRNPGMRFITIPERKTNHALSVAESLWIVRGMNDLDALPGHYAKTVYLFSDDGKHYRGGYGPRIRHYDGTMEQHQEGKHNRHSHGVDQLDYVVKLLLKDKFTRQAEINIHNPIKDDFAEDGSLLQTRDTPCTRALHFMTNAEGNLDMIVKMRSNDLIRGTFLINVPEFTFLQYLVSCMTGIPVGNYYHIADSLHFYDIHKDLVNTIISKDPRDYTTEDPFQYPMTHLTLKDVDNSIDFVLGYEEVLRVDSHLETPNPFEGHSELQIFSDYCEVLRAYWGKKAGLEPDGRSMFYHPQLVQIYS